MSSHEQDATSNETETDRHNNANAFLQVAPIWNLPLYSHLSGKCPRPPRISLSLWRDLPWGALPVCLQITYHQFDHPPDTMVLKEIVLNCKSPDLFICTVANDSALERERKIKRDVHCLEKVSLWDWSWSWALQLCEKKDTRQTLIAWCIYFLFDWWVVSYDSGGFHWLKLRYCSIPILCTRTTSAFGLIHKNNAFLTIYAEFIVRWGSCIEITYNNMCFVLGKASNNVICLI